MKCPRKAVSYSFPYDTHTYTQHIQDYQCIISRYLQEIFPSLIIDDETWLDVITISHKRVDTWKQLSDGPFVDIIIRRNGRVVVKYVGDTDHEDAQVEVEEVEVSLYDPESLPRISEIVSKL